MDENPLTETGLHLLRLLPDSKVRDCHEIFLAVTALLSEKMCNFAP